MKIHEHNWQLTNDPSVGEEPEPKGWLSKLIDYLLGIPGSCCGVRTYELMFIEKYECSICHKIDVKFIRHRGVCRVCGGLRPIDPLEGVDIP